MSELTETLMQYGIGGIFLIVCIYAVVALFKRLDRKDDQHKVERKDWYEQRGRDTDKIGVALDKITEATQSNTEAFKELKIIMQIGKGKNHD